MPKYASLVTVDDDFQNVQELASLWGDVRTELESLNAELENTYAMLGEYDFLVIMDVPDRESAYQVALTMEGHGLDMQTMEIVPTDEFANLVEDL